MKDIAIIILAAGKSTRMNSKRIKLLHPLMGIPMLSYPIELAKKLSSKKIILVVGYQRELIEERFKEKGLFFIVQKKQLGTGHAVMCTKDALKDFKGDILILCGDVPLVKENTIKELIEIHQSTRAKVTVLTMNIEDPMGYGRIIRNENSEILRIVEEKDASDEQKRIKEVNSGIYCIKADYLFDALEKVGRNNMNSEYYLTDIVVEENALGLLSKSSFDVLGINNRLEMAKANELIRTEILEKIMLGGVSIIDPYSTYIEREVSIGEDTTIFPNCSIRGKSVIGRDCIIEPGCIINDSEVGNKVNIRPYCVISNSKIANEETIGPFAYLQPNSELK
ncbi:MAG: bifunctional UDP-N-acetylglucosamine diphosphorylase/glucosamine-1-phosphate N-acetyltransferase GlmU [Thermodesulfobacteriota bacterium]|nr:bifunctional UDP-N-acetylglucosamine diphosphorylase/glucosamine-1-phosphate N-acetyltransferase GlmU [Thermodesulfobacteriota bacterium]